MMDFLIKKIKGPSKKTPLRKMTIVFLQCDSALFYTSKVTQTGEMFYKFCNILFQKKTLCKL